jgi:Ca2+-transporting ATPase
MGAAKADIDRHELLRRMPEVIEEAFDPGLMMMATVHELANGGFLVAVKVAPDAVMGACSTVGETEDPLDDQLRNEWGQRNHRMAADGLRVLALAAKSVDSTDANLYSDLNLVALAAMVDPPRDEVRDAIEECRHAGIEVVMVTGDQAATAGFIAGELGMGDGMTVITGRQLAEAGPEDDGIRRSGVYARTTPEQKLDLITARQAAGESVAMIGDGVNDAPALKRADIGVAMGIRGTEVAKEASDVVIGDDRFGSIVAAIKEGRVIFDNIRKFVLYLLSSNLSEIIVVAVGSVLTLPVPILPLQILYLNLITDVFHAGVGRRKSDPGVMDRPPVRVLRAF